MPAAVFAAAIARYVGGMRDVRVMTVVRVVGVVRRFRFRASRGSFQAFSFFSSFGCFFFFDFAFDFFHGRRPMVLVLRRRRFVDRSDLPRLRDRFGLGGGPPSAGADGGCHSHAQRDKKRSFGADLLKLGRHCAYLIPTVKNLPEKSRIFSD